MNTLEDLLQKECPFEPWQFIEAKEVLDWLWHNVSDAELQKWHMGSVHDRLDYYLFNYAYNKMGLKPISKCSIKEIEEELKRRKEKKRTIVMAQLIDKDALVAEIERLRDEKGTFYASDVLYNLEDFLDTLEVKEVNLDNYTIMEEIRKCGCNPSEFDVAKHFFELGLKAQKGE